jgi:hypothetical protein
VITCGIGACASSVPACSAGIAGRCIPHPPGEETCNGVDDDCDGETDEGVCPGAGPSSGGSGDDEAPARGHGCRWAGGEGRGGAAGWWILALALRRARWGRGTGPSRPLRATRRAFARNSPPHAISPARPGAITSR